jgi:hypothetical protein
MQTVFGSFFLEKIRNLYFFNDFYMLISKKKKKKKLAKYISITELTHLAVSRNIIG